MRNHPTADVQSKNIGSDTIIWQFTVVLPGAVIGKNCNINAHCFIENDVIIEDNVTIKCGVYIWNGIHLEDDVFIGPNVTFVNNNHPRSKLYPKKHIGAYIEHGASIGANSTVLGGIRIGQYAMIGAGSVVTKNIPNNTLWLGNPAHQVGYVCVCGSKLDNAYKCPVCNSLYRLLNDKLIGL